MTCAGRHGVALLLAFVAGHGLVAAPLVHAREHDREQHEDESAVAELAEAWKAGSGAPVDALAFALEHVHDCQRPKPAREHHRHSHGGSGPHGSNALSHLGVALHFAPQLSGLAAAVPEHPAPAPVTAQLRGTLRHLVPEWSQGPPSDR